MAHQAKRTSARDALFFASLQKGAVVTAACQAAGYRHSSVYRWRQHHQTFATLWAKAQDVAAGLLGEEPGRRRERGGQQEAQNVKIEFVVCNHLRELIHRLAQEEINSVLKRPNSSCRHGALMTRPLVEPEVMESCTTGDVWDPFDLVDKHDRTA